ncbi:hypothetical protein ACNQ1O_01520 [Mycoplasma sp. B6188]|uniref:hypothetical protein n=1 Tax=Mycoplasma sp. B6188 TaxID=3401673 RepID=UPI003AAE2B64
MQKEKLVPAIRFKGFDEEWKEKKLSNLAEIYDGIHETPKYTKSGVMFLSVEDIDSLKSNKFVSYEYYKRMYKIYPQKNDIFMTRIGSVGITNIIQSNEIMAYYVSLALIKSKINPFFLNQTLKNPYSQKEIFSRTLTTAIPKKINKNEIAEILIHFSDSAYEQQKIGLFFTNLDILIHSQELKLEKLQTIKQSLSNKIFASFDQKIPEIRFKGFDQEWKRVMLSDYLDYERPDKYIEKLPLLEFGQIPVLTANKSFKLGYTESQNYYAKGDCILFDDFTLDSKYVDFPFMVVSSALKILSLKNNQDSLPYYFAILKNNTFESQGHARHYISIVAKSLIKISNNIEERNLIGLLFTNIDSLIHSQEQKLEKLNNIKQALLEKMFC